jgi:choline/glycine/proline betaine transport protein
MILIVMCFSLYKGLDEDYKKLKGIAKELENYEEIVSELVKNKIVIKTKNQ